MEISADSAFLLTCPGRDRAVSGRITPRNCLQPAPARMPLRTRIPRAAVSPSPLAEPGSQDSVATIRLPFTGLFPEAVSFHSGRLALFEAMLWSCVNRSGKNRQESHVQMC
jgi:hypothetical protein